MEAHTPLVLHNRPNIIPEKFNVSFQLVYLCKRNAIADSPAMQSWYYFRSWFYCITDKLQVFSELVALVYDLWSESPEARPKAEATHIALQNFRLSIANFRSSVSQCNIRIGK